MCQTSVISENIVRLSTRSYRHRMEAVVPQGYTVRRLARLNRDLDEFYELLYSQWQTVTETDYRIFGKQLDIMLATLKELVAVCRKLSKKLGFSHEVDKLDMNYSALMEVNHDIVNFRIRLPKDKEMKQIMESASEASELMAQ